MGYSWVSTEARTGKIISDLLNFDLPSVKMTAGRYETTSGTLPINTADAPADWQRATQEGAATLILLADNPADPSHGIPIWGGIVTMVELTEADTVTVSLVTAEGYLDRRFVGDKTYAATGQNAIVADLIASFTADGSTYGLPIRVQQVGGVGVLRDRSFADIDDKTVYSVLTDLAGLQSPIEWYIGYEWQTAPERITPVLYVGSRIGTPAPAGLGPSATFEIPGAISTIKLTRSYQAGNGANDVMAVSSGQGTARPQSPRQTAPNAARLTFEHRFTPSTSITDIATLTAHAQTALAALAGGSVTGQFSAAEVDAPRLGIDWGMGDDVGYTIGGINSDGTQQVPAFPGGLSGTGRVVGWELTLGDTRMVTPILASSTGGFNA